MNLDMRLRTLARESEWFWAALMAARQMNLASWCIGAGAVRNLVWDALHGFEVPSALPDIDLAHFDASDYSRESDAAIQLRLCRLHSRVRWDVTNQAAVHTWYEEVFGYPVLPYSSLEDAVSSWPEFATSVGIALRWDDSIDVVAPHGLDDLFDMVVRRNPARVSLSAYTDRLEQKRYQDRWPMVKIIALERQTDDGGA
ncbi:nucleotidyltransferase family protein [Pandoraea apista]|uniref:Nucleotidyltransferase family protein n=2 Tax=Burkholderiaceae TaxID=119060 RepID=A0A5E4RKT6_9BURK|nr:hypothetical protein SG18_22060 [Pandoraea apista]AKH74350.1 hypothetical protein XM39_22240 [Pandoraea apista]AKI62899.1 hypothetical protein AA956_15565 [Pandoraea apista]VVD62639.1 hypothetical protein PPN31114_00181 [Pandoraea pneumonica]